jgi:hypothetical protein
MSKQKMLAARELIQEKRYAEARALLKTIDDPKAKEWLKKLDEIDPPFPTLSAPGGGESAYEPYLKQWLEVEKTILLLGALGLVLTAGYLWLVNPLRQFLTFLLFDKPAIRNIVTNAIPALCILLALYAMWRSTQDVRMRRFLLKMKPKQLRVATAISILLGIFEMALSVNKSSNRELLLGFLWVIVGLLNAWRASKATKLRDYGYR